MSTANELVRSPRTVGVAPRWVAYRGSNGSMIDTPTWVMNAIAPSRAMAGLRPRVQPRSRVSMDAGPEVTGPCSLGGQLIRRRGRDCRVCRRNGLAMPDVIHAGATV